MINKILAQLCFTVGPVGLINHSVFISRVPELIIRTDVLSNQQNPYTGSLIFRMRTIKSRKAKWNPLELPQPMKIVNQKQHHIPGKTAEISDINKAVKDAVMIILTFPFNSLT